MKLELPLFASIPKTGPNPPIIIDYDEQFVENDRGNIEEMINYITEQFRVLTGVPRRFFNNGRN